MNDTTTFRIDLPWQAIFTVPDAAGVGIECRSGSVWITQDNDPRDVVLQAGERFVGDMHRRALVSALERSCIQVTDARPAAMPVAHARHSVPRWRGRRLSLLPA